MKNSKKLLTILCYQKILFFSCVWSNMVQISKKGNEKCEISIIDKERYSWVNGKDLELASDVANWPQIFDKCDPEK